jgi:hypothetical protein
MSKKLQYIQFPKIYSDSKITNISTADYYRNNVPHELLHAICYRGDVFLYHDLSHGLMFVVGTEDMSRRHFVLTCLCPNIVLGFIPYITFLLFPEIVGLGLFGIICIGMGFGDWINVYHAVKQMPWNAKTYLCGMHSYWYVEQGV